MGFFGEFSDWLDRILALYISDNTVRIAALLEPPIITLGVLYVIVWGYLHLVGKLDEPFLTGVKRIFILAIIIGLSIHLWMYNEIIVDTFFAAPQSVASLMVGEFDHIDAADQVLFEGGDAASLLIARGSLFGEHIAFYLAGLLVHVVIGVTAAYTTFLLTLSRIALSILLALGPLFISFLLFETTKRFFESWIAQLANYAFITILTVMVAALMLHVVSATAEDVVARGGNIEVADGIRLCVAAGLTLLIMRQVMPIAAGLASGLALSTFGVASAAVAWGLGTSKRSAGHFVRGLGDRETTRWDPLSRKAGYYGARALRRGAQALGQSWRENSIRAR